MQFLKLTPTIISMSDSHKPHHYQRISTQVRVQLLRLYNSQNMNATQAGKILGIKSSTAKLIVRRFKKKGTMFIKKQKLKNPQKTISQPSYVQKVLGQVQLETPIQPVIQSNILPWNTVLNLDMHIQFNYGLFMVPFNPFYWF